MRHAPRAPSVPDAPTLPGRRRLLAAAAAGAASSLAGGCVTPPAPPRSLDSARAPRVGDRWTYAYRSEWSNVAPRTLEVAALAVSAQEIRDRMSVNGESTGAERSFDAQFRIVERPLGGVVIAEFSPYLEAFGPPPAGTYAVAIPPSAFGSAWSGTGRVVGTDRIAVGAGSFDAIRVRIDAWRPFLTGMDDAADAVRIFASAWFAPAPRRLVRFSYLSQAHRLNPLARDHLELLSYRAA